MSTVSICKFNLRLLLVAFFTLQLAFASSVRLGGQQIQEDGGPQSGDFIPPNEHESHLYNPIIENKDGVLVSVGSFRTLDRAAAGKFSHIIMFDYDETMTAFNRANLKLIAESSDRIDYIQKLLGKRIPAKTLAEMRSDRSKELETLTNFIFYENSKDWESPKEPSETEHEIRSILETKNNSEPVDYYLRREIGRFLGRRELSNNSIFGSDSVFNNIKARVAKNEFTVINANLVGTDAMSSLASALKAEKLKVSVLDLSNTVDHIILYGGFAVKEITGQLIRNLKDLPFAADALVLFTITRAIFRIGTPDDQWLYAAHPQEEYFRAAELGYMSNVSGYKAFLTHIVNNRVEQDEENERLIIQNPEMPLTEKAPSFAFACRSFVSTLLTKPVISVLDFVFKK